MSALGQKQTYAPQKLMSALRPSGHVQRTSPSPLLSHKRTFRPRSAEQHCSLNGHAQEFLSGQRIVAKAAQHAAGYQIGIRLMYSACGHAMVRCFDDHSHALRFKDIIDCVCNLSSHLFLDLQSFCIHSTTRASLLIPTTRPLGTYATQAWPMMGAM